MHAAILAPGPSLNGFLENPSSPDVLIGVNRAASAYVCDYWVCGDAATVDAFPAKALPILFVPKALREKITDTQRLEDSIVMEWEEVSSGSHIPLLGNVFSLIAAVVLAVHLKAKSIVMYGCDWQGTLDWDGAETLGDYRGEERWKREKKEFDVIARWLRRQRIPWTRFAWTRSAEPAS